MTGEGESGQEAAPSRTGDALALALGVGALALMAASPWLVDTTGPDPFYKGPLIFPLLALAVVAAGAIPAALRLARGGGRRWRVDGRGVPFPAIRLFLVACLYPWAIQFAGLAAASVGFVFLGLLAVGVRIFPAGATAVVVGAVMHLVFRTILDVWLPAPALPGLIGG